MSDPTPDSTPVQLSFDDLEKWRDVPGYEGLYAVSNLGRVKRLAGSKLGRGYILKEDRMLTPNPDSGGYLAVKLCFQGAKRPIGVHRLVMLAFVGPAPDMDVNHKNEVRNDNRLENLEYLTHAENMAYSAKPKQPEEKQPARLCAKRTAIYIRHLAKTGFSFYDISKAYGISYDAIQSIIDDGDRQ